MSTTGRLQDKVAIVTGAAQGIGAEYARALAAQGAAVIVADILDAGPVAQAIVEPDPLSQPPSAPALQAAWLTGESNGMSGSR